MKKSTRTIDKLEQLIQENIYEQSAARVGVCTGLMNCAKLDEMAKDDLVRVGITPDLYYKTRDDITNRGDRMAAAKYYSQFIQVQFYNMHHTVDGLYIIPVECSLHNSVKHIGGSFIINRRKIKLLEQQLQQEQKEEQQENEHLNAVLDDIM